MQFILRVGVVFLLTFTAVVVAETEKLNQSIDLSMTVYKSPTCGCCRKWVSHLEENNFKVKVIELQDITSIKQKHKIPRKLYSCHTGVMGNYIIEGHVPASIIKEFMLKKMNVAGIAVPGMPAGSPGMESARAQAYTVYTFDNEGSVEVYQNIFPLRLKN